MKDNKLMMCDQCKISVPISDVRYAQKNKDTTMALCSDCRNKTNIKRNISSLSKKQIETSEADVALSKKIEPKKESYMCIQCRYKFKYDPFSEGILRCPYCGKSSYLTRYKSFSSHKLLKESTYLK